MEYEDFSIKIEPRQGDAYPVIVLRSPAGEGRSQFTPPFDPARLAEQAATLDEEVRTRRPATRDASPAATASLPQRIGDQLFTALFSGVVRSLFDRSLGMMQVQQRGLRIKLHIDPEDPSLAALVSLPWEYLYRKETREFLNLSRFTPILRDLDVQRPYMPLQLALPLRILVFAADPIDYPRLELEREQQQMEASLGRLPGVQAEFLMHATLAALQERLGEREYHVLHYMGHGGFDEESGRGVLLLEDDSQRAQRVDGGTLSVLLHDFASLRLVFLNACETARLAGEQGLDPFAGVASSLVMTGIPAVVAMQFPISDRAAITFAQRFYGLLSRGQPVDAAVAEGRRALRMAEPDTLEWGTPVLFTSAPDGVIFTVTGQPQTAAAPPLVHAAADEVDAGEQLRIEKLYNDGLEAFWLEDWARAETCFRQVIAARPDDQDARLKLDEAARRRELQALYAAAQTAQEAGDWPAAIDSLEQLEKRQPGYRDVSERLQVSRRGAQLADLYDQARQLFQAARWNAVLKVFTQIRLLQPDYPDPDRLLEQANTQAETQRKAAALEKHYQQALVELDAGRWAEASALLGGVLAQQPDYRQAQALLSRAQAEQRRVQEEQSRLQAGREKEEKILILYREAQEQLAAGKFNAAETQLQAIRAIDPQFDDPLEVEAQAQAGLERQAGEKQQRDKQAEQTSQMEQRYADAVKLLAANEYQAALERWEALHADDPAFPDRQGVARKARRELEKAARAPESSAGEQDRLSTRKHGWAWWVGMGLIGAIAIFALGMGIYLVGKQPGAGTAPSSEGMIAFHSDRSANLDIYLMTADGKQLAQLTADQNDQFDPVLSPDGARIAYLADTLDGRKIIIQDLQTGKITETSGVWGANTGAWSPDGRQMAVCLSTPEDGTGLFIIDTLADEPKPELIRSDILCRQGISWSPDGGQIAFGGEMETYWAIFIMNRDGSDLRQLTEDGPKSYEPAWSPDGKWIAHTSERSGNNDIWIMDPAGKSLRNLTEQSHNDFEPSWSPDGTSLAFTSDRQGDYEIFTQNFDGGKSVNLTNKASAEGGASWAPLSPIGQKLIETGSIPLVNTALPDQGGLKIYDDFNDPAYDGSYNPDLWTPVDWSESDHAEQIKGELLMREEAAGKSAAIEAAQPYLIEGSTAFEVKIWLPGDSNAMAAAGVSGGSTNWTLLFFDIKGEIDFECVGATETPCSGKGVQPVTWHTIRIEFYPDSDSTIQYFLDGKAVGKEVLSSTNLKGQQLKIVLGILKLDPTGIGDTIDEVFFDDVLIGPFP